MSQLRIAVLTPPSAPAGIAQPAEALFAAEEIGTCIRGLKHRAFQAAYESDPGLTAARLRALDPALVFNLVDTVPEGPDEAWRVAALLEEMGLSFTGAPSAALKVLGDKTVMKRHLEEAGLPVPAGIVGTDPSIRFIVKSATEHHSHGLEAASIVTGPADAITLLETCQIRHGGRWYAETYVDGREFSLSLLDTPDGLTVLPVAEIRFEDLPDDAPRIITRKDGATNARSYTATLARFPHDPADRELFDALRDLARVAWTTFGLKGYAQVDFRVDSGGAPFILEVNANPGLSAGAAFCAAAAQKGFSQTSVVETVIAAALR